MPFSTIMDMLHTFFACALLVSSIKCSGSSRQFPETFQFGASSGAYQYEGAWNEDGKGLSIWDVGTHEKPSRIKDHSNGDVAADTYHLWKNDIKLMKNLGLNFFRFSICWLRVLPTGFTNKINQAGVDYYNNFIDELLKNNITPLVTIYHWGLPEKLQELGGWTNPDIVQWYTDYAKVVFDNFGDRVKLWLTINEPSMICNLGYGKGVMAPFLNITGVGEYMCVKNVLLAHASAYHLYDNNYREQQKGKLGMSLASYWYEPLSDSADDQLSALDYLQFFLGIYANPIFSKDGDFPQVVKQRVAAKSSEQGYSRSRLPTLTPSDINTIRGTADFFGLNSYSTSLTYRNASVNGMYPVPSFDDDAGVGITSDPSWPSSINPSFKSVPWGFYKLIMKIKELYNNPVIYVTENGWPNKGGLEDNDRIEYLNGYLNALLDAIDDGCKVQGYGVWSFLDDFEWVNGYSLKFGLYEVDFSSPNRTRSARKSAYFYSELTRSKTLQRDHNNCDTGDAAAEEDAYVYFLFRIYR